MIPYGKQDINQSDIDAVVDVLKSDFLTQGPKVPEFEYKVAHYVGARHAVAVNNATSALHIACLSLGLDSGDWLWTSPISFVASANCGLYCGARIDFVDIDPQTYNLCPQALEEKLVQAQHRNQLPKVLVVVHMGGNPCDMESIYYLSQTYGFKIIEDASHAIGGTYKEQCIGSCYYSDVTVFSFHPVKIVTTAEGGMALTNNEKTAQRMSLLRSHGITRDRHCMSKDPDGSWYYQQIALGYNYRMTELQAALGITQMERLDDFIERRTQLAERYNNLLSALPVSLPKENHHAKSSWHLYIIRLRLSQLNAGRREIFDTLRNAGIGVNVHYIPIHSQPYYEKMGFYKEMFPRAMDYYREAVSLPLFHSMTDEQQNDVINAIKFAILENQ